MVPVFELYCLFLSKHVHVHMIPLSHLIRWRGRQGSADKVWKQRLSKLPTVMAAEPGLQVQGSRLLPLPPGRKAVGGAHTLGDPESDCL